MMQLNYIYFNLKWIQITGFRFSRSQGDYTMFILGLGVRQHMLKNSSVLTPALYLSFPEKLE